MKTMKNLKNMVIGEVVNGVMFVIIAVMMDWIKYGYFDVEVLRDGFLIMSGITAATIAITYIGYHIGRGVKADIEELRKIRKERREKALARA